MDNFGTVLGILIVIGSLVADIIKRILKQSANKKPLSSPSVPVYDQEQLPDELPASYSESSAFDSESPASYSESPASNPKPRHRSFSEFLSETEPELYREICSMQQAKRAKKSRSKTDSNPYMAYNGAVSHKTKKRTRSNFMTDDKTERERIDPKKLIIYSEIMSPKYKTL